jgi:hypothetical protein
MDKLYCPSFFLFENPHVFFILNDMIFMIASIHS